MKTCFLLAAFAVAAFAQLLPGQLTIGTPGAPDSQDPIGPNTVVATVNGMSVTVADIQKIMQTAPQQLVQTFSKNPQQAIAGVYLYKHLADLAKTAHLDQMSPYKEQLQEAIDQTTQIELANIELNDQHDAFPVSGAQVEQYYQENKARWSEANIKIILIGFKPTVTGTVKPNQSPEDAAKEQAQAMVENHTAQTTRTEEEAKKLADDLVKQLRGGADFGKLVTQYSEDAESKAAGGDFGVPIKSTSSFAPELKKAVLAMKPHEISDPVKEGNGFYIIRMEDLKVEPLNEARETIVQELRDKHMGDFITTLNQQFQPKVERPEFFTQPGKYLAVPAPAKK